MSIINVTAAAADKIHELVLREGREDLALRLAVQPGGCSGLRYSLFFDDRHLDGDVRERHGDIDVVIDAMSAPYLRDAEIDFVDTLDKVGFTLDNPNAAGTCACGDSFH